VNSGVNSGVNSEGNLGVLKLGDPELMKNSERAKPKLTNVYAPVKGRRFRKEE
jgi:hypothetical protein